MSNEPFSLTSCLRAPRRGGAHGAGEEKKKEGKEEAWRAQAVDPVDPVAAAEESRPALLGDHADRNAVQQQRRRRRKTHHLHARSNGIDAIQKK